MRKTDLLSSVIILVFSLVVFILSLRYHIWIDGEPAEGFFPALLSLVLCGLSMFSIFIAYRKSEGVQINSVREKIVWRKLLTYVAVLLGYAFFLDFLGFISSSLISLLLILRVAEGVGWLRSIIIITVTLIITHVVFERLLMIRLPRGTLLG